MIFLLPLAALVVALAMRARDLRLAAGPDVVAREPAAWSATRVRAVPDRGRAIAVLAVAEAKRLVTHPVILVGLLLGVAVAGVTGVSSDADGGFRRYAELTGGFATGLYVPPLTFFAAGLCASRPRRSRAGELFDATPATPFDRTLAQCLAALGPALACLALVLADWAYFTVRGVSLPQTPSVWEFAGLPLTVLGAGTLAVMVSRWLPFRGAPLVVMVVLVYASAGLSVDAPMLTTFAEFPEYLPNDTYRLVPRPVVAHALYLLGLDVMAAIGALLRHRGRPARVLLPLGAVATAWTVAAALAAT